MAALVTGASSKANGSISEVSALKAKGSLPHLDPLTATQLSGGKFAESKETYVLKDTTKLITVQYKKAMASKAEEVLDGTPTCHAFLDYIATERLRSMPHKGSEWDKILKWAESFCRKVDLYSNAISGFTAHSWESARLVWGSCRLLLQMGREHEAMLHKVFSVLYQMGQTLDFFLTNKQLFSASAEIQDILAYAYSDMVRFTVEATIYYKKNTGVVLNDFDVRFGRTIDSFFQRKEAFTLTAWACTLREESLVAGSTVTIQVIWQWLAIHDRQLELFLYDRMGRRTARYKDTCEWFETHFKDFQRGSSNVLWVTGQSGSGKSVLMGWILERLARTRGLRNSYDVISFTIDGSLQNHRSSLSVVRALLLQQLGRNVGDVAVYRLLSALYERSERRGVGDNLEGALWKAFDAAVGRSSGKLMIVLDGLDHLEGGEEKIWKLIGHLQGIASKHSGVKCLFLSQPLTKPCPANIRHFVIDESVNSVDIRRFIEISMSSMREFKTLKDVDRVKIVDKITKNSKGSFAWAYFAIQLLRLEKTVTGILNALETFVEFADLLKRLCLRIDLKQPDTRLLLSLILAAERPLSAQELKCLFEIDIVNCTQLTRLTKIEDDLRKAFGPLVVIRDGMVCFSHVAVKDHLLSLVASDEAFNLDIQQAHTELAIRSLAYLKICLAGEGHEPTLEAWSGAGELAQKHHLLEYAARYYAFHFKHSSMHRAKGPHIYTPQFKGCFPGSVVLSLIERNWWETQTSASDAINLHSLALQLRRYALGERHKATIQCLLNVARTRQNLSGYAAAGEAYYEAWKISSTLLGVNHPVTRACAHAIIFCLNSLGGNTKTQVIIERKEIIYKYIYTNGVSQMEKITYGRLLAEIYMHQKKTEEALIVYRDVRKLCVEVYGDLHEDTMQITLQLTAILGQLNRHEESLTLAGTILAICGKLDPWQESRIITTIHLIEAYEKVGEFKKAEDLLLVLWKSIVDVCKSRHEETMYEAKIRIALQYVQFLRRHSRDAEAEKVLIELWGEFKGRLDETDNHGSGFITQITLIGDELVQWKLYAVAEAVFTSLWALYRRTGKSSTPEGISIAIKLSGVLSFKKETQGEEKILKEIFEAAMAAKVIDFTTVINTCIQLSIFYERRQRWADAISVCTRSLKKIWPSLIHFLEGSKAGQPGGMWASMVSFISTIKVDPSKGSCALPVRYHEEAISIARRLAIFYTKENRITEAEGVYLYIHNACRVSLQLTDNYILTATGFLVSFYEDLHRTEDCLRVYNEVFDEYREVLGASHSLSVEITYKLARFCTQHQPRKAESYYLAVVTALGGGTDEHDVGSIEALLALCQIYEQDKKYKDALVYYKKLWRIFCRLGMESGMSEDTVMGMYHTYVRILERESQHARIHEVTVEFRDACIKHYGKHHHRTILATIELAKILQLQESGHQQAILILEEVRKILSEDKELKLAMQGSAADILMMLARLYSNSSTLAPQAEVIYIETWETHWKKYGYTHDESLARLYDLVMFLKKQGTIKTATSTLQTVIIEVITKEKDSMRLYASAEAIAKLYLALGLKDLALELVQELRIQLNSVEVRSSVKFGFSLRKDHFLDRRPFIFIVAFEETLKGSTREGLYNEIMADLMTETTLYESWMRTQKYKGSFETSLSIGARLRHFLLKRERQDECNSVTDELWELFQAGVGEKEKGKKSGIVWDLFLVCVTEMGVEGHRLTVLDAAATAVLSHYAKGDFVGAFDLATWAFNYVKRNGGFFQESNLAVGIKIALCMAGRNGENVKVCQDQKLVAKMSELSRLILIEVLKASESETMSFSMMRIEDVDVIVTLLGEQQNWKDLERVLRSLWDARQSQISWSPHIIVSIGHRLCEVLFAHGNRNEAIALCEDICYNLKRVWGILDSSTVASHNLLSSFYAASASFDKAMDVHAGLLREALNEEAETKDVLPVVSQQLVLLKQSYQRHGKWDRDPQIYKDMWVEIESGFSKEKGWTNMERITDWSPKMSTAQAAENIGVWKAPASWAFVPAKTHVELSRITSVV